MTKTDLFAKAKQLIEIAESDDPKLAAWTAVAKELAALNVDLGHREIASGIGKSQRWVGRVVQWHTSGQDHAHPPFGGPEENEARYERQTKQVLRDPKRRKRALAELPPSDLEDLIEESNEVAIGRVRAKRSEHDTKPTTRDLMGSDPFHPDEFWADNVIIRVNRNARELASLIQRGGGLILGAMEVERAFDYLNEAEQLIAEARAAAQEQARDKVEVS